MFQENSLLSDHQGSPVLEWVAFPFSGDLPNPVVSAIIAKSQDTEKEVVTDKPEGIHLQCCRPQFNSRTGYDQASFTFHRLKHGRQHQPSKQPFQLSPNC